MCFIELFYFDMRILDVMAVNIQLELAADTLRINGCSNTDLSFVKQSKYGVIYIVINENY